MKTVQLEIKLVQAMLLLGYDYQVVDERLIARSANLLEKYHIAMAGQLCPSTSAS